MRQKLRATNSSAPNTGVEIKVPGLGMLLQQDPLADRPISLSARRALFVFDNSWRTAVDF